MNARGSDLTIVLTLKDRVPYTRRWMEYASEQRFPFKVLVADGGMDDSAQAMLSDRARFPNVDYEYVRFAPDRTYSDFYAKMADAIARVRTPFVALADNDDFLVVDGVLRAVEFLSGNPGYVACGGQGAAFWVGEARGQSADTALYGPQVEWKCTREPDSLSGESARDRLLALTRSRSDVFYYDVKRTAIAVRELEAIRRLDLADLFLVEILVWHMTPIAGKTKRLDQLYLARQRNSIGSSGVEHQQRHGDWFGRMLVDTWSRDFSRFLDATADFLAEVDGIPVGEAREFVIDTYRAFVSPALLSDLMDEPWVSASVAGVLPVARRLVALPEHSPLRRLARALYRRLPWVSIDFVTGRELVTRPVVNAVRDFRPIRDFLARAR